MHQELIKELHSEWRVLVQAIGQKLKPILQNRDLTKVDGIALLTVKKHRVCTKAELAECLHFEPASLTRSLDRLVKRKLLLRYTDSKDKRYVCLELSPTGKTLTRYLEKSILSVWQNAFKDVSENEIQIFIKLLQNASKQTLIT